MSLFPTPQDYAANPPGSWTIQRLTRRLYALCARDGRVLATYPRRGDAVRDADRIRAQYDQERRATTVDTRS